MRVAAALIASCTLIGVLKLFYSLLCSVAKDFDISIIFDLFENFFSWSIMRHYPYLAGRLFPKVRIRITLSLSWTLAKAFTIRNVAVSVLLSGIKAA